MTISWNKKLLALVAAVCTVVLVTASVMTGWAVGYVRDARAASGGVADSGFPKIAAGYNNSFAIAENGDLYAWGNNDYGQLGFDDMDYRAAPEHVRDGNRKYKAVATGYGHSLAIAANGDLYAWGDGGSGKLGLGNEDSHTTPQHVSNGARKYKAIGVSVNCSFAIAENGDLYSMGSNYNGSLGLGYTGGNADTPQPVPGGRKYKAIAVGYNDFALAIAENGDLYAWGPGGYGHLGLGDTNAYDYPQHVSDGGRKYKAVSAGSDHTLAIAENGDLYAWGYADNSQLGLGDENAHNTPQHVSAGSRKYRAIAAGNSFSLAIAENGDLYAWGAGGVGHLGLGNTWPYVDLDTPMHVSDGFRKYKAIAAGSYHSLAISENSSLYGMGDGGSGQLGLGDNMAPHNLPTFVPLILTILGDQLQQQINAFLVSKDAPLAIAAGGHSSFAIAANGDLCAWGNGSSGRLGLGNTTSYNSPQPVIENHKWGAIAAGQSHTLAITSTGKLFSWGNNASDQLGLSYAAPQYNTPQLVTFYNTPNVQVKAIAAGGNHSLALDEGGTLYAWGSNIHGQIGQGDGFMYPTFHFPHDVNPGWTSRKYKAIAAGDAHNLAIAENGDLYAWGRNDYGQLGVNNLTYYDTPQHVNNGGRKYKAIAAGDNCSYAIAENGELYAWGDNTYYYLGIGGSDGNVNIPTLVYSGGRKYKAISTSGYHTLAIAENGSLYSWGEASSGQLGIGASLNASIPQHVKNDNRKYKAISASNNHSLAVAENGDLYVFGQNSEGQLGLGTSGSGTNKNIPTLNMGLTITVLLEKRVTDLLTELNTVKGDYTTLNFTVSGLETTLSGLNTRVGTLETDYTTMLGTVSGHITAIGALETEDEVLGGLISDLLTDVTALLFEMNNTGGKVTQNYTDLFDKIATDISAIQTVAYDDVAIWQGVALLEKSITDLGKTYVEKAEVEKQIAALNSAITTLKNENIAAVTADLDARIAELEAILDGQNNKGRFTPIEIGAMIAGGTLLLGLIFVTILYRQAARDRKYLKLSKDAAFEQLSKGQ